MSKHDYTKYSGNMVVDPAIEEIVNAVAEPDPVEEPQEVLGYVNCKLLNVREEPSKDANVVCKIASKNEVEIDLENSTDEFFKIVTAAGVEGFCMREFITLI